MKGSFILLLFLSAAVIHGLSADGDTFSAVGPDGSDETRAVGVPNTGKWKLSNRCTTRKNVKCNPVSVTQCPRLYSARSAKSMDERDKFFDAYCFTRSRVDFVCCESDSSTQRPLTSATPDENPVPLHCGKSAFNRTIQRLVGAEPATLGAWPWMAALYVKHIYTENSWFVCGGSLIGNEWVLTAAHCIPKNPDHTLASVRLGDLDLNSTLQDGATPIDMNISHWIIHPKYSREKVLNDIALVRLDKPVKYTDYIRPICIQRGIFANESTYLKMKPVVIGWGATYSGDTNPPTYLQQVGLNVVSYDDCNKNYSKSSWSKQIRVEPTNLCASGPGKDSCQGDSGGPLMFLDSDLSWAQGGIVSFGKGCAQRHFPGVYTKVSSYIDWINEKTRLNF